MGIAKWLGLRPKPTKKRPVKAKANDYPPLPAQDQCEFDRFLDPLLTEKVRRYLEIGARHGGSFNAVMRSLPSGSIGIAVDLPGVSWGRDDSADRIAPRHWRSVQRWLSRRVDCSAVAKTQPSSMQSPSMLPSMRSSSTVIIPMKAFVPTGSTMENWRVSWRFTTLQATTS